MEAVDALRDDWPIALHGGADGILDCFDFSECEPASTAKFNECFLSLDGTPPDTRRSAAEPRVGALTPRTLCSADGLFGGMLPEWDDAAIDVDAPGDFLFADPFANDETDETEDTEETNDAREEARLLAQLKAVRAKKRARQMKKRTFDQDRAISKASGQSTRKTLKLPGKSTGKGPGTSAAPPPSSVSKPDSPSSPSAPLLPSTPPTPKRAVPVLASTEPPLPCHPDAPAPADALRGRQGFIPFEKLATNEHSCWPYTRLRVRIVPNATSTEAVESCWA